MYEIIGVLCNKGHWNVVNFKNEDILYYWEAHANYTYEEASQICRSKNMPSRYSLDLILPSLMDDSGMRYRDETIIIATCN